MRLARFMFVAVAVVSIATSAFSGGSNLQKLGKFGYRSYDKFKNQTVVVWPNIKLYPDSTAWGPRPMTLTVGFQCDGDTLLPPTDVMFSFQYIGDEWMFLRESERELIFLSGEERIPSKILFHDGKVGRGYVEETMTAMVPADLARRLLSQPTEAKLGRMTFVMRHRKTSAALDEFLELLKRSE